MQKQCIIAKIAYHSKMTESELTKLILREGWLLHERINFARKNNLRTNTKDDDYIKKWCEVITNGKNTDLHILKKRLEWGEVSIENINWACNPEDWATPKDPYWYRYLYEARKILENSAPDFNRREMDIPFGHLWQPIKKEAELQLKQKINLKHITISDQVYTDLSHELSKKLGMITQHALWELFNQFRTPGQILVAHLSITSGQQSFIGEGYKEFIKNLFVKGLEPLLEEYPVIGRYIGTAINQWHNNSEQLLTRIDLNSAEISSLFNVQLNPEIISIKQNQGDSHNNGQSVAIITIKNGKHEITRIVYKPKNLLVDKTFQKGIEDLSSLNEMPKLKTFKILNKANYGFCEFVTHEYSDSSKLDLFYYNAGRLMAILHVFGATDCHHENLICSGNQLVMIDMETILEADHKITSKEAIDKQIHSIRIGLESLRYSVLRSGLLPNWICIDRNEPFDVSALGVQANDISVKETVWTMINTDGMHVETSIRKAKTPTCLPTQKELNLIKDGYVDKICDGFKDQATNIFKNKQVAKYALYNLNDLITRYVPRPTYLYYSIQSECFTPSAMRNALNHSLPCEKLYRSLLSLDERPNQWAIADEEVRQIHEMDIPFFISNTRKVSLKTNNDIMIDSDLFLSDGITSAEKRIDELEDNQIKLQCSLIRGSFQSKGFTHATKQNSSSKCREISDTENEPSIKEASYKAASIILEDVWKSAIYNSENEPEWLGIDITPNDNYFTFGVLGSSIYSGYCGIALSLIRFAEISRSRGLIYKSELWRERSKQILKKFYKLCIDSNRDNQLERFINNSPAGSIGTGGILQLFSILKNNGYVEIEAISHDLISKINIKCLLDQNNADMLSGLAGLIPSLIHFNSNESKELALLLSHEIVKRQTRSGGWSNQQPGLHPLTGLSHGASGIGLALLDSAFSLKQDSQVFKNAFLRSIEYEQSVFDKQYNNWPDFRQTSQAKSFGFSWCHGSPGILLARIAAYKIGLKDQMIQDDIRRSKKSTLSILNEAYSMKEYPDNLCCGLFGLLSILRIYYWLTGETAPSNVSAIESSLLKEMKMGKEYNLFNTSSGNLSIPGLFTGNCGIALALSEMGARPVYLSYLLTGGVLR